MHSEQTRVAPAIALERETVSDDDLRAAGVDLQRDFPGACIDEFRRYPVLSEGGWFMVIKHQPTLQSVSRTPWGMFGPIEPLSAGLLDAF